MPNHLDPISDLKYCVDPFHGPREYPPLQASEISRPTDLPRLPLESFERIISFIANDCWLECNPEPLLFCALTCRDWLPRSRFHLYRSVLLKNEKQFARFLATIRSTRLLGLFVHELVLGTNISIDDEEENGVIGSTRIKEAPVYSWLSQVPTHILPLTPSVSSILLCCLPPIHGPTEKMISQFKTHKSLYSLTLYNCRFASARDFRRFLSWFPSLGRLHLRRIYILRTESDTPLDTFHARRVPAVVELQLWDSPDVHVINNVISCQITQNIRKLQYVCDHKAMAPALAGVISRCAASLEELELVLKDVGSGGVRALGIPDKLDFSVAFRLTTLRLCIHAITGMEPFIDIFRIPPQLEYLTIAVLLVSTSVPRVVALEWETLDKYLAGPGFNRLKNVKIVLHEHLVWSIDRINLHRGIWGRMPLLESRNTVRILLRTLDYLDTTNLWL
ncbi:hypothetical protein BXZ70DRAFT_117060 [Cristinia sonorae]|uniref:F-box domain-containing protein n=1 Tax=Cristinia sonorae TaxID=1940300 RepID=A0A8K0URS8_9AGAR|nr:hypothetical protein BXZ70DRAFT_117060 [Cristinia sonorae]